MDEMMQSIDRRKLFIGASASTLLAMPALAQPGAGDAKPVDAKPPAGMPAKRPRVCVTAPTAS